MVFFSFVVIHVSAYPNIYVSIYLNGLLYHIRNETHHMYLYTSAEFMVSHSLHSHVCVFWFEHDFLNFSNENNFENKEGRNCFNLKFVWMCGWITYQIRLCCNQNLLLFIFFRLKLVQFRFIVTFQIVTLLAYRIYSWILL